MNFNVYIGRIAVKDELVIKNRRLSFMLAVDRPSSQNDKTDFLPIVAWDKMAENIVKYAGKGSRIGIQGELHSNTYGEGSSKQTRYEIVVGKVTFIDRKKKVEDDPEYGAMDFSGPGEMNFSGEGELPY